MCNKSRRLCNRLRRKVYVYSIQLYYVYVEVYVNLQVEVVKVLNFPLNSTYECEDVNQKSSLSPQGGRRRRLRLGRKPGCDTNLEFLVQIQGRVERYVLIILPNILIKSL